MSLATATYLMSTDRSFAAHVVSNPEGTLASRGITLAADEMEALRQVISNSVLHIEDLAAAGWMGVAPAAKVENLAAAGWYGSAATQPVKIEDMAAAGWR